MLPNNKKKFGILSLLAISMLLPFAIQLGLSLSRDLFGLEISVNYLPITTMAVFLVTLLVWILLATLLGKQFGGLFKRPRIVHLREVQVRILIQFLLNSIVFASGLFVYLVLFAGLLTPVFEIDQPDKTGLAHLFDWIVPLILLFAGTTLVCALVASFVWTIAVARWVPNLNDRKQRLERAEYRRKLARERAEENRIAQLSKPEFSTRLTQYVSNVENAVDNHVSHPSPDDDEPFVSKAKYWQCEPFHERTLPKPIEFIRRILRRISQAVHGT